MTVYALLNKMIDIHSVDNYISPIAGNF